MVRQAPPDEGAVTAALLVFLGGGLGSLARYGVSLASLALFGPQFPWGTLAVNVVGGLAMGLSAGLIEHRAGFPWPQEAKALLMTGVLGGFTTFSAFSLDAVALWERGSTGLAALYVAASVALSIGALVAGVAMARALV
jgi:CrcB protein